MLVSRRGARTGHKGVCAAAACAGIRTAAKPTVVDQSRVLETLGQLADSADWRGVDWQERAVMAVADDVQKFMPDVASFVCPNLGNVYQKLGDFSKVIEYHAHKKSRTTWRLQRK